MSLRLTTKGENITYKHRNNEKRTKGDGASFSHLFPLALLREKRIFR